MANETIPASCMAGANVDVSWDEEKSSAAAIAQANPARSEKLGRADRIAQCGIWLAFRRESYYKNICYGICLTPIKPSGAGGKE